MWEAAAGWLDGIIEVSYFLLDLRLFFNLCGFYNL